MGGGDGVTMAVEATADPGEGTLHVVDSQLVQSKVVKLRT